LRASRLGYRKTTQLPSIAKAVSDHPIPSNCKGATPACEESMSGEMYRKDALCVALYVKREQHELERSEKE